MATLGTVCCCPHSQNCGVRLTCRLANHIHIFTKVALAFSEMLPILYVSSC